MFHFPGKPLIPSPGLRYEPSSEGFGRDYLGSHPRQLQKIGAPRSLDHPATNCGAAAGGIIPGSHAYGDLHPEYYVHTCFPLDAALYCRNRGRKTPGILESIIG